ncbi:hypothetical protein BK809_0000964 [Diplodia seriata]|uniref:Uncharacterized protein n=1 Tax=Diplodia seriata TaxID=420778 RepID=A0A1S8B5S9_9PEZI|nr:hypothetical protein BK809_0000964 [Diplodia seriata]
MSASVRFDHRQCHMSVHAVLLDEVASLSAFHRYEDDQRYPSNRAGIASAYGSPGATRDAFGRTITAGTNLMCDGETALEGHTLLLEPRQWRDDMAGVKTRTLGLADFMKRNKYLLLFDQTLEDLIFRTAGLAADSWPSVSRVLGRWKSNSRIYNPGKAYRDAVSCAVNVLAWRRVITTAKGYLGLAPAATEAGHKIFIILGCDSPIVLQNRGNHYRVVGECYVQGFMNGEIDEIVRKGHLTVTAIDLA